VSLNRYIKLAVLISVAFIPSIIYMVWIRNAERYGRNSWWILGAIFIWGAVTAIAISLILEILLVKAYGDFERTYEILQRHENLETLVLACVIAPFVEEGAKALGVFAARKHIFEIEDGFVFGAAAGLGFAATENLLYESFTFVRFGLVAYIIIAVIRSTSSAFLHGSATAVSGYGISRRVLYGRSFLPFFLLAVLMHATFNFLASFSLLFEGTELPLLGLGLAIVFGIVSIVIIRRKIAELDAVRRAIRTAKR